MSQLTCRELSLGYEGKEIISNLSFHVNAGDYLCIVGENGSGKSTLMKTILGLRKPMKGEIITGDGLRSQAFREGADSDRFIQRLKSASPWKISARWVSRT